MNFVTIRSERKIVDPAVYSVSVTIFFGIPQKSVLCPSLFIWCTQELLFCKLVFL
jgi:hypothetical protein